MSSLQRRIAVLRGVEPPQAAPPPPRPDGLPEPEIRSVRLSLADRAEADICDLLGIWLESSGYQPFYEVPIGKSRPDVVGVRADATIGIEAKLDAFADVVHQGIRIARRFDRPYVALPPLPAAEAARLVVRIGRERPVLPLPGVLAVTREVIELVAPSDHPRRPITPDELRRIAELHGSSRGGVPGGSTFERDCRLWTAAVEGESIPELARRSGIPAPTLRTVLRRVAEAREHALGCPGEAGCPEGDGSMARARRGVVHRNLLALRELPAATARLAEALR